jgi:hypothetical protein
MPLQPHLCRLCRPSFTPCEPHQSRGTNSHSWWLVLLPNSHPTQVIHKAQPAATHDAHTRAKGGCHQQQCSPRKRLHIQHPHTTQGVRQTTACTSTLSDTAPCMADDHTPASHQLPDPVQQTTPCAPACKCRAFKLRSNPDAALAQPKAASWDLTTSKPERQPDWAAKTVMAAEAEWLHGPPSHATLH